MAQSFDVKRLRHIADVMEAITNADKPYLENDPNDPQEEGLTFRVDVRWYRESIGDIQDTTGLGDYMFHVPNDPPKA